MAKGRKLTTSRSERYLGSYGHGHGTISETAEFEEDDVWSVVNGVVNGGSDDHSINQSESEWNPGDAAENKGCIGKSRRYVVRDDRSHVGGLSLAFDDDLGKTASSPRILHQFRGHDSVASPRARNMATSAPVNVPDWSKIYRANSVESLHDLDDGADNFEMMPPHEYVARDYRQNAANSVFEGVGRTLKGRDMRRVRDAVWSRTGFNG